MPPPQYCLILSGSHHTTAPSSQVTAPASFPGVLSLLLPFVFPTVTTAGQQMSLVFISPVPVAPGESTQAWPPKLLVPWPQRLAQGWEWTEARPIWPPDFRGNYLETEVLVPQGFSEGNAGLELRAPISCLENLCEHEGNKRKTAQRSRKVPDDALYTWIQLGLQLTLLLDLQVQEPLNSLLCLSQ